MDATKAQLWLMGCGRRVRTVSLSIAIVLLIPVIISAQTSDTKGDPAKTLTASSSDVPAAQDYPQPASQYPAQQGAGRVAATVGAFKFDFNGTLLLNLSASDQPVVGAEVPLWAQPGSGNVTFPDGSSGRTHDLFITARQTRLGVTISPSMPLSGWSPTAVVDIDFFGSRPADNFVTEDRAFGAPRLRRAFFQVSKGTWKIVAGQDTVIIAPLDPISLSHVAVPLGATAGNLWGWLPQVRVEKTQKLTENTSALFQVGLLRPEFGDSRLSDNLTNLTTAPPTSIDNATAGTRSTMPFYQARAAISTPLNGSTATVGAGVHYGREVVGVDHTIDSWAFALDFRVPVLTRLILRGESYLGSNLIPFGGGIAQGVAAIPATAPFTQIQKIGDAGGWGELTVRLTTDDKNHFYVGAGTDDPVDHNLLPGSTRSRNTFYWASYFHRFSNGITLAEEFSNWEFQTRVPTATSAGPKGTYGRANVYNVSLAYTF